MAVTSVVVVMWIAVALGVRGLYSLMMNTRVVSEPETPEPQPEYIRTRDMKYVPITDDVVLRFLAEELPKRDDELTRDCRVIHAVHVLAYANDFGEIDYYAYATVIPRRFAPVQTAVQLAVVIRRDEGRKPYILSAVPREQALWSPIGTAVDLCEKDREGVALAPNYFESYLKTV